MAVRNLEQLRRDQVTLADELRRLAQPPADIAQLPTPGAATTVIAWGKVTSVVTSDPTYGPHLLVQPQKFSGTPPTPSDTTGPTLRCYPAPDHVITDYAVNEYVKLQTCRHALIADKSA